MKPRTTRPRAGCRVHAYVDMFNPVVRHAYMSAGMAPKAHRPAYSNEMGVILILRRHDPHLGCLNAIAGVNKAATKIQEDCRV